MPLVKPFPGLRPAAGRADDVVAPPYDVMNREEAKSMVEGRPFSFLHISRPEIDLDDSVDAYDESVYLKGKENLQSMIDDGVLEQDETDCYYVYRLTMGDHVQTGLVTVASVEAYDNDRIKKHEFTRPVKEDDRVRQVDTLNAQTGPVFLVYPSAEALDNKLKQIAESKPDMAVTASDGVKHEIWVVNQADEINFINDAFESMDALYVADGHHRSAAGSRVGNARKEANAEHSGAEPYNYFLSVIFPHNQMQILDYNRVIKDLNGLGVDDFLAEIRKTFSLTESDHPFKPDSVATFGMYLDDKWYKLEITEDKIPSDPVASLDISLLQDNLIAPVLGIEDPRRDDRIDFVGGIRGLAELEKRVNSGEWTVAFSFFPTSMQALMSVADAGEVMPPKSTWFEPKLADGLVSHLL